LIFTIPEKKKIGIGEFNSNITDGLSGFLLTLQLLFSGFIKKEAVYQPE